jgi:hypothetical protein
LLPTKITNITHDSTHYWLKPNFTNTETSNCTNLQLKEATFFSTPQFHKRILQFSDFKTTFKHYLTWKNVIIYANKDELQETDERYVFQWDYWIVTLQSRLDGQASFILDNNLYTIWKWKTRRKKRPVLEQIKLHKEPKERAEKDNCKCLTPLNKQKEHDLSREIKGFNYEHCMKQCKLKKNKENRYLWWKLTTFPSPDLFFQRKKKLCEKQNQIQ